MLSQSLRDTRCFPSFPSNFCGVNWRAAAKNAHARRLTAVFVKPDLIPRVLALIGQTSRSIKNKNSFQYPKVSPDARPLTKKPEDSGYEIASNHKTSLKFALLVSQCRSRGETLENRFLEISSSKRVGIHYERLYHVRMHSEKDKEKLSCKHHVICTEKRCWRGLLSIVNQLEIKARKTSHTK